MIVNPNKDKALKDGLFNYYKNDIMQRKIRKNESLNQEKNYDKNFIEEIKRSHDEEIFKRELEKSHRVNKSMQEYSDLMVRKEEERKRKYDQKYKIQQLEIYNQNQNSYKMPNHNMPLPINNNQYEFSNELNKIFRENNRKGENLNYIMHPNYKVGVKQIEEIEKNKKFEIQKYYKQILDSQVANPEMSGEFKKRNSGNNQQEINNMISNPCIYIQFLS
jgi:hypothetical protein